MESLSVEFFCGTPEFCCGDGGGVCVNCQYPFAGSPVILKLSVWLGIQHLWVRQEG